MRVRVRGFASAAEALGGAERGFELADGATVAAALEAVALVTPKLASRIEDLLTAVNGAQTARAHPLRDGDLLVLLPPFSGG